MTTPMKGGSMYATNVITRDIRLQGDNVEKILVDYFEKIKSINDKVAVISKEEIENIMKEHNKAPHLRTAQKHLAEEV